MSIGKIQVLVVENDEVNAQVARAMLEKLGCAVETAEDGAEAVELFGNATYDLIFMSWQMPRMDGAEATARIRGLPGGRAIPIVCTSARVGRQESLAAGMSELMPKPFRIDNFKQELSKWTRWEEGQSVGSDR